MNPLNPFRLLDQLLHPNEARLDEIERDLVTLIEGQKCMSAQLATLTAQVSATDTVMQSALTLIQGFSTRLDAAAAANDDGAALATLAADLKSNSSALAAAVAANTPAAPDQPASTEPAPATDAPPPPAPATDESGSADPGVTQPAPAV